jgi:hypothetical protein
MLRLCFGCSGMAGHLNSVIAMFKINKQMPPKRSFATIAEPPDQDDVTRFTKSF